MNSAATEASPEARRRQRKRTVSLGRTIRTLTEGLDGVATSGLGVGTNEIRTAARIVARAAAADLDGYWSKVRKTVSGPIDVIDMFSGCGGMSAGFHGLNGAISAYRLAAAVDMDEVANRTYEANLGLEPARMDIAQLASGTKHLAKFERARRSNAPLVLIGCAPCQGFSSHRNKAGMKDARNSLFGDFAGIATRLSPDAIVVENVPELLTERYWPFLTEARSRLEQSGYYVHLMVHNMAQFGLPQERFRALMVAMKKPFAAPEGFLKRNEFRTVRSALGDLPCVRAGQRDSSDEMHYSANHKHSTVETIRAVPKDGGNRPDHVGPECLRRAAKKNGRAVYEDVYGRLFWDRPAITITAYARNPASGRYVHPEQNRGLTVREAALLQGFPRNYWFAGSLDQRFRQIGNAVPPVFAVFLAAHLLGELLAEPISPQDFDRGITRPVGSSFSRLIPALKTAAPERFLARRVEGQIQRRLIG